MMMWLSVILVLGASVAGQETVTCIGLGEFTQDPPFDNLPLPHCPEELGADLHLEYFCKPLTGDADSVVGVDRTTIPPNWSVDRDTVFVVHGWTNDIDTGWLEGFKEEYLNHYDVNLVEVGWGGPYGAGDINYQWSASTTRTIGGHLAEVIHNLVVNGTASPSSFHLVGHSLGAHLSGHAGRWLSQKYGLLIDRVTGMDPAGPEFVSVPDRTVGLYTDCARFVDTINTDNVLGSTPTTMGHQNYYPNAGEHQPGCDLIDNVCSHARVINLYQESLDTETCLFAARESCTDSADIPGNCTSCGGVCGAMGYPANSYNDGIYYLTTNDIAPFCQG